MYFASLACLSYTAFAFQQTRSLIGVHEDRHGLVDPSVYETAFRDSSNLIQIAHTHSPQKSPQDALTGFLDNINSAVTKLQSILSPAASTSFLQTKQVRPFSSLQEEKMAEVRLAANEQALNDKQSMLRSKIETLKNQVQDEISAAHHEKQEIEERMARRGVAPGAGLSSSFVQTKLSTDKTQRELEKIHEMARAWKVAADRFSHAELASVAEPDAAVIEANSRVEADRKKLKRLEALVNVDVEKVEKDAALVNAQRIEMKKQRAMNDLESINQ